MPTLCQCLRLSSIAALIIIRQYVFCKVHFLVKVLCLVFSSPEQSSGWTFRIVGCPASVVVRCASCVVRQQFVNTLQDTFLAQSYSNLLRMLLLTKSRSSSILGHFGSKSRSLGQIWEKACEHSRDHIFDPILLKLAQNVHLDKI